MAEIIHNGAAVWNTLEQRADQDDFLFGYFDDAEDHAGFSPVSTRALENWPTMLRDYFQNPHEWPCPEISDRLRAHSLDPLDPPPSAPRNCIFVSHRQ